MKKYASTLTALLLVLSPLRAQQVITAAEGGGASIVVDVKDDGTAMVVAHGDQAPRAASPKVKFNTKPGVTYHDAFLKLKDYKMKEVEGADGQVLITGTVTPDRPLKAAFVAVEIRSIDGRTIDVRLAGLPNLAPNRPGQFSIQVPGKAAKKAKSRPVVHFMASNLELINSAMQPAEIEAAQAKRSEYTLKKTPNRKVAPVYTVPPAYPPAQRGVAEVRTVKVKALIDPEGKVTAATVAEGVGPELDAAACAAVKAWIFAPAIKDGQFVESSAVIPVKFAPMAK